MLAIFGREAKLQSTAALQTLREILGFIGKTAYNLRSYFFFFVAIGNFYFIEDITNLRNNRMRFI